MENIQKQTESICKIKGKSMKRTVRIIILGILLLMTVICSVVGASAEANDISETNYNLGTRRITELTGRCNEHYIKKPNASIGNAGGNTCTVIVSYKNRIELLVFSDRAQREDITAEIDLLYKKGMAAGILSWIY